MFVHKKSPKELLYIFFYFNRINLLLKIFQKKIIQKEKFLKRVNFYSFQSYYIFKKTN